MQTVARDKLAAALADPDFCGNSTACWPPHARPKRHRLGFKKTHPGSALTCVAYFCMEYMLTEALPIYSGGLGNVAGDQLIGGWRLLTALGLKPEVCHLNEGHQWAETRVRNW
ncbi:MAG: DUF3417 domain-containing protein, partial [Opitutaceae bacterium]